MKLSYDKWTAWWEWKAWFEEAWVCDELKLANPEPKLKDHPWLDAEKWKAIKAEVKEWFFKHGIKDYEKEFWGINETN